ncbi:MAG: FAD-dependent oxidoreductase, partial [Tepidiformaceae bacterium]
TSLCVIGGGPIGVEFAQMMNRLGVATTLLEVGPRILERDDPQAAEVITRVMTNEGVVVRTGVRILSVERTPTGKRVHFEKRGAKQSLDAERLLVAAGRRPSIESLELGSAGIDHSEKGVVVDDQLRTSRKHIFAIGDVAGGYQFTHVAEAQGRLAANIIADKRFQKWSDRVVPRVTYTAPEVASVGLREDEARKAGRRDVRTWEVPLTSIDRAITMGETEGFFKVVTARGWNRMVPGLRKLMGDEIVGASLVAPNAGDLLMPIVIAMKAHLPMGIVAWNMQAYPTLSLGIRQVTGLPFE